MCLIGYKPKSASDYKRILWESGNSESEVRETILGKREMVFLLPITFYYSVQCLYIRSSATVNIGEKEETQTVKSSTCSAASGYFPNALLAMNVNE